MKPQLLILPRLGGTTSSRKGLVRSAAIRAFDEMLPRTRRDGDHALRLGTNSRTARRCAERKYEVNRDPCGTPDTVTKQLRDLGSCYSDGNLESLSWEFYQEGNSSMVDQGQQLTRFAQAVWHAVK
jgi:hypothetical protein